jgi:hypothetical protein
MSHRLIQSLADAGRSIETGPRAKPLEKRCAGCGTGIPRRKTWCGPCYDERLQANILAHRKKMKQL